MKTTTQRIVEDGPGVHYEYDLYEFEASGVKYIARSYTSEPDEAQFLRKELRGKMLQLEPSDVQSPLFREAQAYLKGHGKTRLSYLSGAAGGYVVVQP